MCHKYDIYILFKYLKYSDYIATNLMVKPVHCDFWEETSTQYKCRTTETYKRAYVRTEFLSSLCQQRQGPKLSRNTANRVNKTTDSNMTPPPPEKKKR